MYNSILLNEYDMTWHDMIWYDMIWRPNTPESISDGDLPQTHWSNPQRFPDPLAVL